jgi:hypothetical protein
MRNARTAVSWKDKKFFGVNNLNSDLTYCVQISDQYLGGNWLNTFNNGGKKLRKEIDKAD